MIDSQGIGYDYRSVMHYSANAFSKNGQATIDPKVYFYAYNIIQYSHMVKDSRISILYQYYIEQCYIAKKNIFTF